jgi:pimeloyl-ACP methyl ester carboxylesterase
MSGKLTKSMFGLVKSVGALAATAVAGGIAYSFLRLNHEVDFPPALSAQRKWFASDRAGNLSYYVDKMGTGRPLVLIHSVNAAPSAHEMAPLFEFYQGQRPVYALDLPGFGFSERTPRRYSPELYESAIVDFLRSEVGEAADVIALSLGCEFAARAAVAEPSLFNSLVFISPSGLGSRDMPLPGDRIHRFVSFPLWSQPLFDLLTSRASIRWFLGKSFVGEPAQSFLDYAYITSHQPGARYAPLWFISGVLFTPGVRTAVYENVTRPTLVLYDEDPNVNFDRLPDLLAVNGRWRAVRLQPTRGLPHWEKLPETTTILADFWQDIASRIVK